MSAIDGRRSVDAAGLRPCSRTVSALRGSRGVTGVETAIILIAFVVVASVFAYTVLSADIFTADRSKEAINAGIDTAASSIELVGSMKADGVKATVLTTVDASSSWTVSATVTADTETDDRKEGTASVKFTIAGGFTTGVIAYENLGSTVDLSSHYAAGLWIKSDTTLATGVIQLLLDDSAGCGSPEESLQVGALTAGAWTQVHMNVSDASALSAVACTGLNAASDPGAIVLFVDLIQGPPELQRVHVALSSTLPTEGVAFVPRQTAIATVSCSTRSIRPTHSSSPISTPTNWCATWRGRPKSWASATAT